MLDEPLTREQLELLSIDGDYDSFDLINVRDTALHYWTVADDLGNDLKQQASINRAKREELEARLREVEESRSTIMRDLTARCRELEAERDLAKQELGGATLLLNYAEARVAELEQQTYSKTEFDNPHNDHEAHQRPDGTPL